ncbi:MULTISPECIES: OmpH family outer membrane protein [Pelosinus]|jgi:outer membrane protein|uniref:Outer membrane chaperone Skp (OmpH) n=2 Tax=Pelosinus TaxID=365348 RepID=I8TVT4_9FIRM|nr:MULTISPECIES: OmpH family outer membrane protein [Pelosinus]AJQ25951.1 outer membrane chaperone Skp (OmpH) [Pelosinus fermentans JBW45]MCC5464195.1 OmpH family outer membrane protein [Pelosinus baikalensis]
MLKLQKKQVKFVSLAIAVMFLLGIVGLAVSQSSTSYAAEANNSSKIGVVNHQLLISQHPDMANAQKTMQAEVEQAKKDFEEKSATMNDKEKQDYYAQVQQRLTLKEQELINPVFEKVDAAIKAVADAKGLSVVMDKGNVVYGGQDITAEVGKKISGK